MGRFIIARNSAINPLTALSSMENTSLRTLNTGTFIVDGTLGGRPGSIEIYGIGFGANGQNLLQPNGGAIVTRVYVVVDGVRLVDISDVSINGNNLYRWLALGDGNAFDAAIMSGPSEVRLSDFSEAQGGREGHDSMFGYGGNDTLQGDSENDSLWGGDGDDVLTGGTGNDLVLGEAGFDVARFVVGRASAEWALLADGSWRVTASTEGTDIISGIERIDFIGTSVMLGNTARPRDLNGDGRADLAWRGADGTVALWTMSNLSITGGGTVARVGSDWTLLGLAETDSNGRADLVWLSNAGAIQVWSMNGTSVGLANVPGSRPLGTTFQGMADMTGDGNADLLWRDLSTGAVSMQRLDGVYGVSGSRSVGTVTTDWTIAGLGDFNADGRADILWRGAAGQVVVWAMDGNTVIGGGQVANVGLDWQVRGLADFNADGRADMVWRNSTTGDVVVWLMNGTSIIGGGAVAQVETSWNIRAVGDVNGDGRADLIWRSGGGTVVNWFMDGATVRGGGVVLDVSTDWQMV
ncbi:FG-GAP-like repeat-containing protein [Falsiroseomonas stagni]|uniref:Hemolysin-type calcium-binding repeat-containing protein n=1 Tax=Falsiroseomonas stagni DSM 19981 TaxID=1123062 RepID=A0A1I3Y013_9PROT|nr:FG-GAP-like repeat-containing protein [Falsiroseomonas stagni]SFK25093.1 Hemolysin-type calcium-binding repeat-containing protein [Falsiroseomonas stagni DSM 19981]